MSAVISECGRYRYRLERDAALDGTGQVLFIGVNPSTADATTDDATVRKWRGFASSWGYRGFMVGNVFAYRSTDVRALARAVDPVGEHATLHLLSMMAEADCVVPCWGSRTKVPRPLRHRFDTVRELIRHNAKAIKVLGLTASGDPMHPLMLAYSTPRQDWKP